MADPIAEVILSLLVSGSIDTTNASGALESINKFLNDWIGLLVAVIGGILSIISFFYNRRRDKLNGLSEAFKILNDNMHREARRVVHTGGEEITAATRKILGFDNSVHDEVARVCGDIVMTDMEQIGTMARNKLFYEKVFLQRYSSSILMEWRNLKTSVLKQRNARGTPEYGQNFEYLYNAAEKYWKKKNPNHDPNEVMERIENIRQGLRELPSID